MQSERVFDDDALAATAPAEKIGLVATINPEGLPHITLLTSIRAVGPDRLTIGEFCKGSSKNHMQQNPKVGFLIMTRDRRLWRGQACWTHLRQEGPEYEQYNSLPMFRYNAYFGINTVHYLELKALWPFEKLPMGAVLSGLLKTRLAKGARSGTRGESILKPFARRLFDRTDALKFIAHIDADGYPRIIPVIQGQSSDGRRIVFALQPYGAELAHIARESMVAVFGLTMAMEDVLVRGRYRPERLRWIPMGIVDIDWVYNSMPPCHGQIYPPAPLSPVTDF
jgi:hypothetical protein